MKIYPQEAAQQHEPELEPETFTFMATGTNDLGAITDLLNKLHDLIHEGNNISSQVRYYLSGPLEEGDKCGYENTGMPYGYGLIGHIHGLVFNQNVTVEQLKRIAAAL